MAKKPWDGRFKSEVDELMRDFSESISFDQRLIAVDILGSMAHVAMLGETGVLSEEEALTIAAALASILDDYQNEKIDFTIDLEDVHMNIEGLLREKIGDLAGKLHTGRSRNDQVALDMRLYFREQAHEVNDLLEDLCRAFVTQAEACKDAIMPGFTHTRKAQPVLFSHHLLAYVEMFLRDLERVRQCDERINLCPLGAGALAGTTFPIDRDQIATALGFNGLTENSIDAVSDRDYLLEFASVGAIIMVHLSRLMEELIWWSLDDIGFIELPESLCTGSSMMPNKKNPDAAELVRGKTGRVIGALVGLLTVMKATPLSYNRDFQEDKQGMFDLADTVLDCLEISIKLVDGMEARPERMRAAAQTGFILATDLADYLATKGLPFRDAHEVAGKIVRHCEENQKRLEELTLFELKRFSDLFDHDVAKWLSLEASVKRRDVYGGTAPRRIKARIKQLKKILEMK